MTKQCSKCKIIKSVAEFHKRQASPDHLAPFCKPCNITHSLEWNKKNRERKRAINEKYRRAHPEKNALRAKRWRQKYPERYQLSFIKSHLKTRYGITLDQFNEMLKSQNNSCAICGGQNRKNFRLHVDHNHETGQVRGLLCLNCNTGIGSLKHSSSLLQSALNYLASVPPLPTLR